MAAAVGVLAGTIGIVLEQQVQPAGAAVRSALARVSVDETGNELTFPSQVPSLSDDGRYVTFFTEAAIDQRDMNQTADVYVRDVLRRTTTLISRFSDGNGNGQASSIDPDISGNGRYVVFISLNAVPGPSPPDTDGRYDVYLVDRGAPSADGSFEAVPGSPVLVSVDDARFTGEVYASGPSVSSDGTQVAYDLARYDGETPSGPAVIRDRDRNGNGIPAEDPSDEATIFPSGGFRDGRPRISADGRHLVFIDLSCACSTTSDVAPEPQAAVVTTPTPNAAYVYDRTLDGSTPLDRPENTRLSLVTSGQFTDTAIGGAPRTKPLQGTYSEAPDISADGSVVVYEFHYSDVGIDSDLPYKVRQVISVTRGPDGAPASAFVVSALSDYVSEPPGDGDSLRPRISDDGRYVGFVSEADDLTINDMPAHGFTCSEGAAAGASCHAYVVDRLAPGAPKLVSTTSVTGPNGLPIVGDRRSYQVTVSADGRFVAFTSAAGNLEDDDSNEVSDVFLLQWTPRLKAVPSPLEFARTPVGATAGPLVVTVDTDDFGPWKADGIRIEGPLDNDFRVNPAACGSGVYSRGKPCLIPVSFRPSDTGNRSARLEVQRLDTLYSPDGPAVVELSGKANVPEAPGESERISYGSPGLTPPGELPRDSRNPAISANGRYVAFETETDLDPRDQNNRIDVYVRDRLRDTTAIVSLRPSGINPPSSCAPGIICVSAYASFEPSVSGDGRYIAFTSADPEMAQEGAGPAPNDSGATDVFVLDRGPADTNGDFTAARSITNASVGAAGEPISAGARAPSISGDGSQIVFTTSIYVGPDYDRRVLIRDNDADGDGVFPEAGDGRTVTISTTSDFDAFAPEPAVSADGDHVALVDEKVAVDGGGDDISAPIVYVYDRDVDGDGRRDEAGATRYAEVTTGQFTPRPPGGLGGLADTFSFEPAIDGDGTTVAYAFRYDNDGITSDLPYNSPQILVADREPGTGAVRSTEVVSVAGPGPLEDNVGDAGSYQPDVSDDGRYVAFSTVAENLHPVDMSGRKLSPYDGGPCADGGISICQVLVVDRTAPGNAGAPQLVSAGPDGLPNGESTSPAVSGDGRFVAFDSVASNLLGTTLNPDTPPPSIACPCPVDGNNRRDVFTREWLPNLVIDTTSIGFPDAFIGMSTGIRSATLSTPSFGPAPVLAVSLVGANPGDFVITGTSNCVPPLSSAPAAPVDPVPGYAIVHLDTPCVVSTAFLPTRAGPRVAVLRLVTGSPFSNAPPVIREVRLTGQGLDVPIEPGDGPKDTPKGDPGGGPGKTQLPSLLLDAAWLDFGEHLVGTTSPERVLTVTNAGGAPLGIAKVTLVGLNPGDFSIASDTCKGRTLAPGERCFVTLTFRPTQPGEREAVLRFDDTAQGSPHLVKLTGRAPTPTLRVNPAVSIPGRTADVAGESWPPNSSVVITMTEVDRGTVAFPETFAVQTDGEGRLATTILVFPRGAVGPRLVVATGATPELRAQAPLLVVIPSINGPDFVVRG